MLATVGGAVGVVVVSFVVCRLSFVMALLSVSVSSLELSYSNLDSSFGDVDSRHARRRRGTLDLDFTNPPQLLDSRHGCWHSCGSLAHMA
ncbi:hypothetical protein F4823DRAFT_430913 [Ustulina deusta]|nr:hypothetical protein F4823DRAFT_430913 [Ustulina deusta]